MAVDKVILVFYYLTSALLLDDNISRMYLFNIVYNDSINKLNHFIVCRLRYNIIYI